MDTTGPECIFILILIIIVVVKGLVPSAPLVLMPCPARACSCPSSTPPNSFSHLFTLNFSLVLSSFTPDQVHSLLLLLLPLVAFFLVNFKCKLNSTLLKFVQEAAATAATTTNDDDHCRCSYAIK